MRPPSTRTALRVALLAGLLAYGSLTVAAAEDAIRVGGTGSATRLLQVLGDAFSKSPSPGGNVVVVPGLGSRGGQKALLAGVIDIAVSASPLDAPERNQGLVATELARTPLVFATSTKNPVSNLRLEDVINMYGGKTVTWPDGSRVRLILRPENDSDTITLKKISPAMEQAVNHAHARPGLSLAASDQDSADALETIPGAIGTSTLLLMTTEQRSLKALPINGIRPTPQTIADASYPYFKTLYLITRQAPAAPAQRFMSFVASPPGRETLARLGCWVP